MTTDTYDDEDDERLPRQEPTPDTYGNGGEMIDEATGFGWNDLSLDEIAKRNQQIVERQAQAMKKQANLYRDVLWLNPQGRELLNHLCNITLRRQTWPTALYANHQALIAEGIWREAQNCFVAMMINAIRVAENQTPQERSEN